MLYEDEPVEPVEVPPSFWVLGGAAGGVVVVGMVVGIPAPATPWGGPALVGLGCYFAVCSTFAQDFPLYRLKVARARRWYGDAATHLGYRALGFAALAAGLLFTWGTLTSRPPREEAVVHRPAPPAPPVVATAVPAQPLPDNVLAVGAITAFLVADGALYWAEDLDHHDAAIRTRPLAGGPVVTLASPRGRVESLALHGDALYYVHGRDLARVRLRDRRVYEMARVEATGLAEVADGVVYRYAAGLAVVDATERPRVLAVPNAADVGRFVATEDAVFVEVASRRGKDIALVPADGGMARFVEQGVDPRAFVVGEGALYWSDADGVVHRVDRSGRRRTESRKIGSVLTLAVVGDEVVAPICADGGCALGAHRSDRVRTLVDGLGLVLEVVRDPLDRVVYVHEQADRGSGVRRVPVP